MATRQSKWTDQIHSPISVLNHAQGLHLERLTSEDLDKLTSDSRTRRQDVREMFASWH